MKKLNFSIVAMILTALLLVTGLVGCGGGGDAESVAENFMSAVADLDFEKAADYSSEELRPMILMMATAVEEATEEDLAGERLENVSLISSDIQEDKGVVLFNVEGEEQEVSMIKQDGKWKVGDADIK